MNSYKCKCCGAEILYDEGQNIAKCLYCGNNVAIIHKEYTDLNIKKIVPFEILKDEAISNLKKCVNCNLDKIVEVKKIYLPIRFCDFEFDYLCNYQYSVRESDGNGNSYTTYYDTEDLVDGYGDNEIIIGDSKIPDVINICDLEKKTVNFDPALLKGVSIEYVKIDEEDNEMIIGKLKAKIRNFSKGLFHDVTKIYSENCSLYNINMDPYTTLIPIYVIKTSDGVIYNFPGVSVGSSKNNLNEIFKPIKNCISVLASIAMIFFVFAILGGTVASEYKFIGYFFSLVVIVIVVVAIYSIFKKEKINVINTIRYKKVSFNPEEKHIKF